MFNYVTPVLTSIPGAIDSRMMSVTADANLKIYSTDPSKHGTYYFKMIMDSNENVLDIATQTCLFKIVIHKALCVSGFTDPVITTSINYYMRPAQPNQIDYAGLGNGSCKYSTTLTQKDGSPIDTAVFTFTPENIQMDPANNNLWVTHGSPQLVINTTDIAKDATVSLRLTLFSFETPADTR